MSAPCGGMAGGAELPEWLQNCVNTCGTDGECLALCILEALPSGGAS